MAEHDRLHSLPGVVLPAGCPSFAPWQGRAGPGACMRSTADAGGWQACNSSRQAATALMLLQSMPSCLRPPSCRAALQWGARWSRPRLGRRRWSTTAEKQVRWPPASQIRNRCAAVGGRGEGGGGVWVLVRGRLGGGGASGRSSCGSGYPAQQLAHGCTAELAAACCAPLQVYPATGVGLMRRTCHPST
jgi:hypothetical protein